MALLAGHKTNFRTLEQASEDGNLALLECTDKATGNPVAVVCAVNRGHDEEGREEFEFVPIAKLFDGDPYDELNPPA